MWLKTIRSRKNETAGSQAPDGRLSPDQTSPERIQSTDFLASRTLGNGTPPVAAAPDAAGWSRIAPCAQNSLLDRTA